MSGEEWVILADRMADIGTDLEYIFYSLFMGLFFGRFSFAFLDRNRKKAGIAGVLYAVMMLFNIYIPNDLPPGTGSLLRIGAGFLFLYIQDRNRPRQKVFVSLLYYTVVTLSLRIASEQGLYVNDFLFGLPGLNTTPIRTIVLFYVLLMEDVAVYALLLALGVKLSLRFICGYDEEISSRDLLALTLPFLMVFAESLVYVEYYAVYSGYYTVLNDMGDTKALEDLSHNSFPRLFTYVVFYLFIMTFLWCFFDIKRLTREKIGTAVLEEQTRALKKHVEKMDEMYGQIRSIRHDMNHHTQVLSMLLEEGKNEEAGAYLHSLKDSVKESRPAVVTGNPVTDIILSEKAVEAQKEGIGFNSDFAYPKDFGFDLFDISGILGNAFSNAFAACKVGAPMCPKISVRSVIKGNVYLIEMRNTFSGNLSFDPDTDLPKRLDNTAGHGIGLLNMKKIAKKYGGNISFEQGDGEVILTVILQKVN
ncbi:MAG: GHKL domain-containing protein [Lachnospiraceae bacterium]|nr:GHKL domain-containing protein [Lachnospiraceae bacterium]